MDSSASNIVCKIIIVTILSNLFHYASLKGTSLCKDTRIAMLSLSYNNKFRRLIEIATELHLVGVCSKRRWSWEKRSEVKINDDM